MHPSDELAPQALPMFLSTDVVGERIRIRQARAQDMPRVREVMLSALIDGKDSLFLYNFPHRREFPDENTYFFSKLRIDPILFEENSVLFVAELLQAQDGQPEKWHVIAVAAWTWNSKTNAPPPDPSMNNSWLKSLGRTYLNARNAIIKRVFDRRDVDEAHYAAFFAMLDTIEKEIWSLRFPDAIHLGALYTHVNYWGKGAARGLVRWGLDLADRRSVPVIVETTDAAGFYEKLGFRIVDERHVKSDAEDRGVKLFLLVWSADAAENSLPRREGSSKTMRYL